MFLAVCDWNTGEGTREPWKGGYSANQALVNKEVFVFFKSYLKTKQNKTENSHLLICFEVEIKMLIYKIAESIFLVILYNRPNLNVVLFKS